MIIIDNDYQLPETGDIGSIWFAALEFNIQRLATHNHDGANSEKILSTAVTGDSQTISSGSFVLVGSEYRQQLTIPNAGLFDEVGIEVRDPATGDQVFLKIEKTSPTQFYVYTSFPQDYDVVYV